MQRLFDSASDLQNPDDLAASPQPTPRDATVEGLDRLIRLACRVLKTPVALLSLVIDDRQIETRCVGLPETGATWREAALSDSFRRWVIGRDQPLIVPDVWAAPLLDQNQAIRELGIRACLGVPLVNLDGQTRGVFGVFAASPRAWPPADVEILSELGHLAMTEFQLRAEAAAHAEAVTRARDEFLSIAAHELRNPVAAITATAQLLKRTLDQGRIEPERLGRYATTLDQTSRKFGTLVDDLLEASAARTASIPLHREWIDLALLIRAVVARRPTPLHRVQVTGTGEPGPILADWDRLERVIASLLDNAIKYSPEGGEIAIGVTRGSADLLLQIKDSGIGIPAEDLGRIFKPFGRAGNASRLNLPGLGLGLYVCRQIVAAHGGWLWAESPGEGRGTTLFVRLPLAALPKRTGAMDNAGHAANRVLVVEDEPAIRAAVSDLLTDEGYSVRLAANGREALTVLLEWSPDLILLDLIMPIMDGWAFQAAQQRLPENLKQVPVVVMSGTPDLVASPRTPRPAATIRKPFDIDDVVTTVARVLSTD